MIGYIKAKVSQAKDFLKEQASNAWDWAKTGVKTVAAALGIGAAIEVVTEQGSAAAADAATLVTTATTAFEAVTVLVVAMVGFYLIVRIVKGIRR